MSVIETQSYLFGEYRVDPGSLTVYRQGRQVNLNRIRTAVLVALLERAGQVVAKEEIIGQVWPGLTDPAKGDATLSQQIFHLRRLLHDNPSSPSYILTVPGTGYLFYPPVRALLSDGREGPVGRAAQIRDKAGAEISAPQSQAPGKGPTGGGRPPATWLAASMLRLFILAGMIAGSSYMIKIWLARGVEGMKVRESTVSTLISRPGRKDGLAYSRDGRMLAFLDEGRTKDTNDLFVRRTGSDDILQLTNNPLLEEMITWSPDNQQIAFLRRDDSAARKYSILTIPAFGGAERQIGEAIDGLDWDPHGRYLAISDDEGPGTPTGIYLLSLDGRERQPLSNPPPGSNVFDYEPRFSPDGREVAFTRSTSLSTSEVLIINRETGKLRQVTFDQREARSPQWSSNGREILFISNRNDNWRIWRISKNGGPPRLVESIVGEIASFSLSPTMETIAFVERFDNSDLQLHGLMPPGEEAAADPIIESPCRANSTRPDHSPRFSPDGKRIVFVSNRSGIDQLWLMDKECQQGRQLTHFDRNGVGSPQWSPDGEQIVFDFFSDNQADIYRIELIGGQLTRLTNDPASDYLPSWSNDGRWIYFTSHRGEGQGQGEGQGEGKIPGISQTSRICRIWKMRADGAEPQAVTVRSGREPFQSADGLRLYYIWDDQIWVKNLRDGSESRVEALAGYKIDRYWAIGRTDLYFLAPEDDGDSQLLALNLQSNQIRRVHEVSGSRVPYVSGLSVSVDDRWLVISLIDKSFSNISVASNW